MRLQQANQGFKCMAIDPGMALSGEVDLTAWASVSRALDRAVADHAEGQDLVFDLGDLSFIDAHGVDLIAEAAHRLGPSERLILQDAPPILMRIARILRLDRDPKLVIRGRGR
jgi:anti-anti-sigma factor